MASLTSQLIFVEDRSTSEIGPQEALLVRNDPYTIYWEEMIDKGKAEAMVVEVRAFLREAEQEFDLISSMNFSNETMNIIYFRVYTVFPTNEELAGFEDLLELINTSLERVLDKYFIFS